MSKQTALTQLVDAIAIDSGNIGIGNGNLLVGKTDTTFSTAGFVLSDVFQATRSNGNPVELNRTTSDGDIIKLYKDGSLVGSIGSEGSGETFFLGSGDVTLGFNAASDTIIPRGTNAANNRTDAISLGNVDNRFKDLHLSGGLYLGGQPLVPTDPIDYEEGTWTPNVVGEVTNGNGTYTKVGSLVTAYFYINLPNIGFSQDPALIDGLPFPANNTSAAQSGQSAGFIAFNSDGKAASLLFETGGSRVGFRSDPSGTALDRGTVAGNTYYGTLIYNTNS